MNGKKSGDELSILRIGRGLKRKSGSGRSRDHQSANEGPTTLKRQGTLEGRVHSELWFRPTRLISIDQSVKRFFAHLYNCDLSPATIKKNRVVIQKQLADFCLDRGFIYLSQLGINELDDFIGTWKESSISKVKKMERLKGFFRFCYSRKLILMIRQWLSQAQSHRISYPSIQPRPNGADPAGL